MKKSARNMLAAPSILLLLVLLLTANSQGLAQNSATKKAPAEPSPATDGRPRVTEAPVDASIPDDSRVDQMLAPYSPKVRELEVVIGKLTGELKKSGSGSGSMGNFVTDGMRAQATVSTGKPVTVALMNGGGMRRSSISEGDLRASDIFELLPFENALITVDLTGAQLTTLLRMIVSRPRSPIRGAHHLQD